MNQILDHSGPKKAKIHRNPGDTAKIIKVYAFFIILFALCFIAKAGYSIYENQKIIDNNNKSLQSQVPQIVLNANEDILSIEVSYTEAIEEVTYQWYRGNNTAEEIEAYENSVDTSSSTSSTTSDDETTDNDTEIKALGKLESFKGTGGNTMTCSNIGIPKGDTTILVTARTKDNITVKYIQTYHTDVGVDKISPEIRAILQGKTLIVTATDETEISKLVYSVNDSQEKEVTERLDEKTIKVEIPLSDTEESKVIISAVDKANNTSEQYSKTFDLYAGTPKIEFSAEPDYSKIYVKVSYSRGISKIEYEFNGESSEKEFDNPEEVQEYEFELECQEGKNVIYVKAIADENGQVYTEDTGDCEYNP